MSIQEVYPCELCEETDYEYAFRQIEAEANVNPTENPTQGDSK